MHEVADMRCMGKYHVTEVSFIANSAVFSRIPAIRNE